MNSKIQAQAPAQGILRTGDWGDTMAYQVVCDCGSPEHDHNVWVEAEDVGVSVTIYARVKSPVWSMNRWQQIWHLLTRGYLHHETTISMNTQQALNYAETLRTAIGQVEKFRKSK